MKNSDNDKDIRVHTRLRELQYLHVHLYIIYIMDYYHVYVYRDLYKCHLRVANIILVYIRLVDIVFIVLIHVRCI